MTDLSQTKGHYLLTFSLRIGSTAALFVICFLLGCGQEDSSSVSSAAPLLSPSIQKDGLSSGRVEVTLLETHLGSETLTLAGKIAYAENGFSRISSPLHGRVLEVRASLGQLVASESILLVIDSPDIAQAYSEYVKEDSELAYATRAVELARDLYENKALPLKDLKFAENELVKAHAEFRRATERLLSFRVPAEELGKPLAQQKITSRFEMKSPMTGTVVERNVTTGQSVGIEAGVLFTIANLDVLQMVADVYERDLALVRTGQVAKVIVEAYPNVKFSATVTAIADVVDPISRTIKVRALVENKDHRLKPEMFAHLHIQLADAKPLLLIPREAVLEIEGKQFVYIVDQTGQYLKREITVSMISSTQVRVLKGLKVGQRIVTKGAVLIKGQEAKQ